MACPPGDRCRGRPLWAREATLFSPCLDAVNRSWERVFRRQSATDRDSDTALLGHLEAQGVVDLAGASPETSNVHARDGREQPVCLPRAGPAPSAQRGG